VVIPDFPRLLQRFFQPLWEAGEAKSSWFNLSSENSPSARKALAISSTLGIFSNSS
jgi:hypothetical protein